MAAASDIDAKELEFCIKGLLFSRPTVVKANVLQRECEEELGKVFPFRQLGFSTFVDYLRSIPSVVQLQPHNGFNPDVFPVASRASSHIDQLVSRQRVAPTKRRGVARRSAYGSRPPAARRRPVREVQQLPSVARPNQLSYSNQSRDFGKRANSSSNYTSSSGNGKRGLDVRDLETDMTREYDKRDLTRNGINSAEDLLSRAGAWVERSETKVYPKIGAKSDILDQSRAKNCIPAEEYDFLDDECDDFDDAFDEYYEEETGKDSEEELSKSVIQHFTRSLGLEENCSSARSLPPAKETSALSSKESACDQSLEILNDDSIISSAMINHFRKILAQNPDGIWASQLQKLYYENFRATLDFLDLGYTSAISLASSLPSVFSIHREGSSDWKLYDARYVTQENLDAQQKNGDTLLSENGRYIPRTIIENIKLMLEKNSNGFRSIDLLQSYQETYRKPLNLDILGFNTLEDFLKILQNDITLIKAQNYYILLPKHTVVPYEAVEPERPDESLNIGAEALGVPIPDDVLKLGDEIPLQELPPVQMDPDPDKPLLDLEVRVAEVITPSFFYMSLDSKHQELENMMDDLEKFYNWEEANYHIPLPYIAENLYCACKFYNYWHRAKIIKIKSHTNVEIEYIDYGTPATVASSELRYLPTEFSSLPAQAICAKLIGVKPLNGEKKYSPEVCASFLKLVENKRLVAHVYEVASRVRHKQERMQLEIILYDTENRIQEIVINDYLIENGLASPVSQTESELPFAGNLPENDYIPSLTNGSSMPLPLDELPSSLLGNGSSSLPVSSLMDHSDYEHQQMLVDHLALQRLQEQIASEYDALIKEKEGAKNPSQQKKSSRPPPGFQEIPTETDIDTSTQLPSISSTFNNMTAEEQKVYIQNYYLMNSTEIYPNLVHQEQYLPRNVYQPSNPSNMPLAGQPVYHSHQSMSQKALMYGSFVPPPNAMSPLPNMYRQQGYQVIPPVPNSFFPVNNPLHVSLPIPIILNPTVAPNYVLMNSQVPNQYYTYFQQSPQNSYGRATPKMHSYGTNNCYPQSVHAVPSRSSSVTPNPTPTPPLATPKPASSPTTSYPPITIPTWPIDNIPAFYTSSSTTGTSVSSTNNSVSIPPIITEISGNNLIPRPGTPLTPASAEVAKICKLSRPNSSASRNSQSSASPSVNILEHKRVCDSSASDSNDKYLPENSAVDPQINKKTLGNALSNSHSAHSAQDLSTYNLNPVSSKTIYDKSVIEVKEIPLPPEMDINRTPLPPASPEKLFSAISSPVESSSAKEESSDDYVSASENVEDLKQRLLNLALIEQCPAVPPSKSPCDTIDDIPDSWENLDLDDTPAKAENYFVDLSKPLEQILENSKSEIGETLKINNPDKPSGELIFPNLSLSSMTIPVNWKDGFNPDSTSILKRCDNKEVKGTSKNPTKKFNVKNVQLQKIEIQGKFVHLLYLNKVPAVILLEFFKQFVPSTTYSVCEMITEVYIKTFYFISRSQYPAVFDELDKLPEFFGGVDKKSVIRFKNKIRVVNLTDVPECLKLLNTSNKPLLDDLKKIAQELEFYS